MTEASANDRSSLQESPAGVVAPSRDRWPVFLALLIFCPLSIFAAVRSNGFLEADGITHYLYARFALQEPHYLVNIWGRPICTGIYALPAHFGGLLAVRFTSLALAVILAAITYRIAVRQNFRWPALAFIFTLAQPLVFLHSWSELTELPFAVLLAASFLAYRNRQWLVLALVAGLLPLSRPEGFGFIILAAVALVLHRRFWWLLVLPIPLILWDYYGWVLYGSTSPWWRWLHDNWPYAGDSLYPSGNIFHFIMLLPAVTSPLIFPATIAGTAILLFHDKMRRRDAESAEESQRKPLKVLSSFLCVISALFASLRRIVFGPDHGARCDVLIAAIPLLILGGHSILYTTGKMASSGELRYMLVVAPFWALLSARGWEWLFEKFAWKGVYRWAGAVALFPILANAYYRVVPRTNEYDHAWQRAESVVTWYTGSGVRESYPRIVASHPGIFYLMDISMTDGSRVVEWRREKLLHPPAGSILIWDPVFSVYNADRQRSVAVEELLSAGWTDADFHAPVLGGGWRILRSPRPLAPTTQE